MYKRVPHALVFVVLLCGCGKSQPQITGPTFGDHSFTFDSVTYTTGGLPTTTKFKDGMVQIRADSVKKEITLEGSCGPGEPTVTAIKIQLSKDETLTLPPKVNEGKWSVTIESNKLQINIRYTMDAVGKDGKVAKADLYIAGN